MLDRVINAPVNLFFDTHRQEKIQQRFTSDLGTLEHNFIGDITHTIYYHMSMFIMISKVEWKVVLVYPLLCLSMNKIFSYAFTAHLKLEKLQRKIWKDKSTAKMETLTGNSTIRAFGQQTNCISQDLNFIDLETITNHNHRGIWGWFDTRRDLCSLICQLISVGFLIHST